MGGMGSCWEEVDDPEADILSCKAWVPAEKGSKDLVKKDYARSMCVGKTKNSRVTPIRTGWHRRAGGKQEMKKHAKRSCILSCKPTNQPEDTSCQFRSGSGQRTALKPEGL